MYFILFNNYDYFFIWILDVEVTFVRCMTVVVHILYFFKAKRVAQPWWLFIATNSWWVWLSYLLDAEVSHVKLMLSVDKMFAFIPQLASLTFASHCIWRKKKKKHNLVKTKSEKWKWEKKKKIKIDQSHGCCKTCGCWRRAILGSTTTTTTVATTQTTTQKYKNNNHNHNQLTFISFVQSFESHSTWMS